jgi:hypothetical protein
MARGNPAALGDRDTLFALWAVTHIDARAGRCGQGGFLMFIKKLAMMAALCALTALTFVASASAVLIEDTTGAELPAGSAIRGTLEAGTHATLTSGLGNITCASSSFTLTMGANTASPVTGTMAANALTFSNCTDTLFGVTVTHCGSTHYSGGNVTTGLLNIGGLQVVCNFSGGGGCEFTVHPGQAGQVVNATHTVGFNNISVTSNGGFCPGSASFSGDYTAVRESNGSGILVT